MLLSVQGIIGAAALGLDVDWSSGWDPFTWLVTCAKEVIKKKLCNLVSLAAKTSYLTKLEKYSELQKCEEY